MAAVQGREEAVSFGSENKTGSAGTAASPEQAKPGAEAEPSLGKTLVAAREKRGLSRAEVVSHTRIPAHYLQMIESSDYALISDQLYLLPFLRRYAAFLGLDGEEIAMRFVREVQRAEGAAPARMSEPLTLADTSKRSHWGRTLGAAAVLVAIAVLYYLAAQHHRAAFRPPPVMPPAPAGVPPLAAAPVAPQAEMPLKEVPETTVVANPAAPSASIEPQPGEPARAAPRGPAAPPAASSSRPASRSAESEGR